MLLTLDKTQGELGPEDILDKAKALHEVGLLSRSRELLRQLTQDENKLKNVDSVFLSYLKQELQERETLPMGPREFNNNAVLLYERGQWHQALDAFIQAFHIMPGNVGIALNLLQSLGSTENINPAIQTEQLRLQCEVILSRNKLSEAQQKRWQQLQSQQKIAI